MRSGWSSRGTLRRSAPSSPSSEVFDPDRRIVWTIFRTSAAAGSSSFGDLKPSWIKNNNSILCGGAGRGTSADRGRHSNRKPSCNDRSQTPDHAAAARAGRKTLGKVFVLILRFLARKGDLIRVQNACKCEKRTSEPHNFVRGGLLHSFFRV